MVRGAARSGTPTKGSNFCSLMVMTRQSAHILMASARVLAAVIHPVPALEFGGDLLDRAFDAERLVTADAERRLFFLDHAGGGAAGRKSICGFSVITFSGQVLLHSPHCTQASSTNFSAGRSGSSSSAPVGQADTQDRHSVQPPTST